MTYMMDEIIEQPDAIRGIIEQTSLSVRYLVDEIRRRQVQFVYIAARGSSDHAAAYCKYLFEVRNGLPVALACPSAFTLYDHPPRFHDRCLVLGISQSGAGPDVIEVVRRARLDGALTACIVNTPQSGLAAVSECAIHLKLGCEKSVAATKTYTGTLAVIALLSSTLTESSDQSISELQNGVNAMEHVIALENQLTSAADHFNTMTECVILARGFNQATALEAALKLMETCYIGARAYSGADFEHGPIAQVGRDLPCIVIAPSGRSLESVASLVLKLKERSSSIFCLSDNAGILAAGSVAIKMPDGIPEWVSPLPYITAMQIFACRLSLSLNLNPDQPRGLNKVTMTV